MKFKVVWSAQVQAYVNSKAPEPRRALWQEIKHLAQWNGRENPPRIRQLEDDLTGYARLRVKGDRVLFRESFERGERVIKCLYAGPRSSVYETFQEIFLDELAS
jgi:mRNA-degrading endonuclease RelE of RelBE toxin-antitoxin system